VAEEKVWERWQQWLNFEAQLLQSVEVRGDRIH